MDWDNVNRREFIKTGIVVPVVALSLPSIIKESGDILQGKGLCLNRVCVDFGNDQKRFDEFLNEQMEWRALGAKKEWQDLYSAQIQEQVKTNKLLGAFRQVFPDAKKIMNVTLWSSREDMMKFHEKIHAKKIEQAIIDNGLSSSMEDYTLPFSEAQALMKEFSVSKNLLEYFAHPQLIG